VAKPPIAEEDFKTLEENVLAALAELTGGKDYAPTESD
jgi:hypothetical protein